MISVPTANPSNLVVLFFSQCLALSTVPAIVLIAGLVGARLNETAALATLPVAASVVGTALGTVPAAMVMRRWGRRAGFIGAMVAGSLFSMAAAIAILISHFWLFCLAILLMGIPVAFVQQFRFAAAESVSPDRVGQAISLLMLSGMVAAWLGPELATLAAESGELPLYSGSFLVMAILYLMAAATLFGYRNTGEHGRQVTSGGGSLFGLLTFPVVLAIAGGMAAYGVMSLVMTATPLELHHGHGHSLQATKVVIQSHIVAMYLPSLITGWLIGRFGCRRVMGAGLITLCISAAIALSGSSYDHFWLALIALGVGWNFLFVSSTTLLMAQVSGPDRFRIQALNDFIVFSTQALAAVGAGWVLAGFGWGILQWLTLPVIASVMLLFLRPISAQPS